MSADSGGCATAISGGSVGITGGSLNQAGGGATTAGAWLNDSVAVAAGGFWIASSAHPVSVAAIDAVLMISLNVCDGMRVLVMVPSLWQGTAVLATKMHSDEWGLPLSFSLRAA
jgi:hypothetical protein